MKAIQLLPAVLLAVATAAWPQTEIERDLDGNASVFQTTPSVPDATRKTGGSNAR